MLEIVQSPPIVFNPYKAKPEDSTDPQLRVDEIGWGDARVVVNHDLSADYMSRERETALLCRIFLGKEAAAEFTNVNFHTHHSRHVAALDALGVHSVGAAVRRMFDPQVGILTVGPGLSPKRTATEKEIELLNIAASDGSYDENCEASKHWKSRDTFMGALRRRKNELGNSQMPTAMLVLHGFMSRALRFDEPLPPHNPWEPPADWSPPPRPDHPPVVSAAPDGLAIAHPSKRNADGLYLPHSALIPQDAALIFSGRSWKHAAVTGINLLGGRARINRDHELAQQLTETELRYLCVGALGLKDPQCEETLYLSPEIGEEIRTTLSQRLSWRKENATMMEVADHAFQRKLLEVVMFADSDLDALLNLHPDFPKYVRDIANRGEDLGELLYIHAAYVNKVYRAAEDARTFMRVDNAALVTAGYLTGALKPKEPRY